MFEHRAALYLAEIVCQAERTLHHISFWCRRTTTRAPLRLLISPGDRNHFLLPELRQQPHLATSVATKHGNGKNAAYKEVLNHLVPPETLAPTPSRGTDEDARNLVLTYRV